MLDRFRAWRIPLWRGVPIAAAVLASVVMLVRSQALWAAQNAERTIWAPALKLVRVLDAYGPSFSLLEVAAAFLAVVAFLSVQRRVDGRRAAAPTLMARLVARAASLRGWTELAVLLESELLPALGVRRSAIILRDGGCLSTVAVAGLDGRLRPAPDACQPLLEVAQDRPLSVQERAQLPQGLRWAHSVTPLRVAGEIIGFWLLGQPQTGIELPWQRRSLPVRALADPLALALARLAQSEQITRLYSANAERQEAERQRMALELHDEILNGLSHLFWQIDGEALTPQLDSSYQALTDALRRIICGLRPAMLDYGLAAALDELIDSLSCLDRAGAIIWDVTHNDQRYSVDVEEHLFRIAQQALENAVRHSRARTIRVQARLEADRVRLVVADDGVGIPGAPHIDLRKLRAQRRFGLTGMYERAQLIGARLVVDSTPGAGTRVVVDWEAEVAH